MSNRWLRFLLALIAIAAAAAAAFRIVQDEQRLAKDGIATRAALFAGESALTHLEQLQASLHAYVAPGQSLGFWEARATLLLDKLRRALLELDTAASADGASLAEALDTSDRLAATEQRIREHARTGQQLLAGDLIFGEARELIDALRLQIAHSRDQIAGAASSRESELRREQIYLVGGAAGILALMMLLLVPTGAPAVTMPPPVSEEAPPKTASPVSVPTAAVDAAYTNNLAALCADIAAATDTRQIEGLLHRARNLLRARGVIVWVSAGNRLELHAAASSGYEPRMVARLGPIHRDTGNLTADAFRENGVRTSSAAGINPAALAVPMPAPDGPAGVFAAELAPGIDIDETKLAMARLIAAQLGPLLGTVPSEPAARAVERP